MPILNIQSSATGLVGVLPSVAYIQTTDTIADVVVNGYLNSSVQSGLASFSLPCMCCVSTISSPGANPVSAWYTLSFSAGNWNLAATSSTGGTASGKGATNNALPDVASTAGSGFAVGDFIIAADSAGTIQDSGMSPSNPSLIKLASVSTPTTIGDLANFADINGTIQDSGVNLQAANVAITSAQFKGMYEAPVLLVGAPGDGNIIVIHSMVLSMTYGTTAYTSASGTSVQAQYGSTANAGGPEATTNEEVSDYFTTANTVYLFTGVNANITSSGIATDLASNQGAYLTVTGGDFATGDSSFTAKILYSVISV